MLAGGRCRASGHADPDRPVGRADADGVAFMGTDSDSYVVAQPNLFALPDPDRMAESHHAAAQFSATEFSATEFSATEFSATAWLPAAG